jgi:hypothetical protein
MSVGEKSAAAVAVLLAIPLMLGSWWFLAQGRDPLPVLVVLPAPMLFACLTLGWIGRRLRWAALVAPIALVATCFGGLVVGSRIGRTRVVVFCQRILASPSASTGFQSELASLAQHAQPECRVHDLSWGSWELGVYSAETLVGYVGVTATADAGLRIDDVSLEPALR